MKSTNIHQAKTHLSRLVQRAAAGEEIIIAKAGIPIAKLVPYRPSTVTRHPGYWHGRVKIQDDFDTLPEEIEASFRGETKMSLLLDTHVLLWWLDDDRMLSHEARKSISDVRHDIYVSAVTAWEISIKKALGKLEAPDDLDAAISANAFLELPITIAHAMAAGKLPNHHSDPFDRMLVAQANLEGLTLVSRDENINKYGVALLKA